MRIKTTLADVCAPGGLQTGPFGSQLKAEEYTNTGTPVVMPRDIVDGRIKTDVIARIPEQRAISLKKHLLHAGDIVFSRRGDLSKVALVSIEEEGFLCGTGCLRARPRPDINSSYLRYVALSKQTIDWLDKNSVGQTMANLNTEILSGLPLFVPSRPIQDEIVEIFSNWDSAIDLTERLIDAKQERHTWLMQQLLTGKRRLPGFRSEWRKTTVGEIAEEVSIRNKGKLGIDEVRAVNKSEGMIPMKSHVMADDLSRYKMVERTWFAYNPMRINIGSICQLMGEEKALVSPDYVVFRCKEQRIDHRFFNAFRRSHRWQSFMDASGNGSVRVRIYFEDLARLTMLLPSLDEQRSIADFISLADREIELLRVQLDALREQKKGLMQQLLTGKVRVKV